MVVWLSVLCGCLIILILILAVKIVLLHRAADEIRTEFSARLSSDTNTGVDIACGDRRMRLLAADINRQLMILRRDKARYLKGDQEVKEAIANISHDLRTPLTAVCGYMDLLKQEEASPEVQQYIEIISGRVEALRRLTEELFQYSMAVSAHMDTARESVVLNQCVEECVAAYYGVLLERGITPDVSLPDRRVVRSLNQPAFSRILENIMSNAVKYSDGDLNISLSEEGRLQFSNTAGALNEVSAGRLFDRFFTVETGRAATGLGLSIAKALTEQLGGSISVAYQERRLTVTIWFPENSVQDRRQGKF